MNNSLESSKYFPYVAWTLVISFALFTYTLTLRLQSDLSDISSGVDRLEQKLNAMEKPVVQNTTTIPTGGTE